MKNIVIKCTIVFVSIYCFSQISIYSNTINGDSAKQKRTLSGMLFYTAVSRGGVQKNESNLIPIPLKDFTLYVISLTAKNNIPKVIQRITTNKKGEFSVSLPPGKYGFISPEDAKDSVAKEQCLPKTTQTSINNIINFSEWECNMACPLDLCLGSIKNIILINHRVTFCVNCQ